MFTLMLAPSVNNISNLSNQRIDSCDTIKQLWLIKAWYKNDFNMFRFFLSPFQYKSGVFCLPHDSGGYNSIIKNILSAITVFYTRIIFSRILTTWLKMPVRTNIISSYSYMSVCGIYRHPWTTDYWLRGFNLKWHTDVISQISCVVAKVFNLGMRSFF